MHKPTADKNKISADFLLQQPVKHLLNLTNTPAWSLTLLHCPLSCNALLIGNSCQMFAVSFPESEGCHFRNGGHRLPQPARLWPLMFIVLWWSCQAHIKVFGLISTKTKPTAALLCSQNGDYDHCFFGLSDGWSSFCIRCCDLETSRAMPRVFGFYQILLKYDWAVL